MLEGLYYNNVFIGMALILTGAMLYVSDKMKPGRKNENSMTVWDALISLCQCVATIPGLSRSRNHDNRRHRNRPAPRLRGEVLVPDVAARGARGEHPEPC